MPTDSAFWRDLETQFRALIHPIRLVATAIDRRWFFTADGPTDQRERKRLRQLFDSLARRAGIAAGTPNRANALEGWLNLLRDESSYFQPIHGSSSHDGVEKNYKGGWIQDLASASAEYCIVCATRAFELEATVANGDSVTGLRRDRYPFRYWLHDHSHEPEADPKAELDYWKAHVWRGYDVLIENYERLGMAWADRHEKLNSATAGLSYDLAVLQANYVIDRGLRGDESAHAFRDEAAALLEEVTSSWRASCERLAVTFDDDTEEVRDLAQPFHRVRDDLRRLLAELPAPNGHSTQKAAQAEKSTVTGPPFRRRASWLATRLHERSWNRHDVERNNGPHHKTVQKILNGRHVREDVLKKLADALSAAPSSLKLPRVNLPDIPTD
jgi:hypothetical protein